MPEGIDAGDAVVTFLADTQQLDLAFDSLGDKAQAAGAKAQAGFSGFDSVIEDQAQAWDGLTPRVEEFDSQIQETNVDMMEAKGSMMLMGEEIGVRIPRHLQRFVAQLPGVGEALQAAFSGIAILFLIQIMAQAVDKISEWTANVLYGADAVKKNMDATAAMNKTLLASADRYDKAKEKLDAFGKTALQLGQEKLKTLNDEIKRNQDIMNGVTKGYTDVQASTGWWARAMDAAKESLFALTGGVVALQTAQMDAAEANRIAAETARTEAAAAAKAAKEAKELQLKENAKMQADADEKDANAALEHWHELSNIAMNGGKEQALLYASDDAEKLDIEKTYEDKSLALEISFLASKRAIAKQYGDVASMKATDAQIESLHAQHVQKMMKLDDEGAIAAKKSAKEIEDSMRAAAAAMKFPDLPVATSHLISFEEAAATLGLKTLPQMKAELEDQEKAFKVLQLAYAGGEVSQKQFDQGLLHILMSERSVAAATGQTTSAIDKQIIALKKLDPSLREDAKSMENMKQFTNQMGTAFEDMTKNLLLGQETASQVMRKFAAAILQSIAEIAEKQGAYELAQGFAGMANPLLGIDVAMAFESAAAYFALAGGISAAGAVAGGTGGGGGGGGAPGGVSAPNTNTGGNVNATGGSQRNIQAFAAGGLISGPTLAMMGEGGPASAGNRPQEAAIPLDNPQAVEKIKNALGAGGGDIHNYHIKGMVSADTMKQFTKRQSQMVKKRQVNLYSTNTFRIQRRST